MTMVPPQNLHLCFAETSHGTCLTVGHMNQLTNYHAFCNSNIVDSDSLAVGHMDEPGPSSKSKVVDEEEDDDEQEQEETDVGWLQLGIGHVTMRLNPDPVEQVTQRRNLIELDLLSDKPAKQLPPFHRGIDLTTPQQNLSQPPPPPPLPPPPPPPPLFLQNQEFFQKPGFGFRQPEVTWSFRPVMEPWYPAASSSNPFYSRPFQHPHMTTAFPAIKAGPSSNLRLVDAPSRPQSGLWFMLQAAQNQTREPVLPQIPKCYLRIKDGKMTILLLMKYLANKLELESESEVEISCRNQRLLPSLTLRYARDAIWCSRDAVTLLPSSPTSEHIMILNYARSG